MREKSRELQQLEDWLAILICTYRKHPSDGLAKVIHYYIRRVTSFESEYARCAVGGHYLSLKKYWQWLSQ
ncbi:hypothetical protein [Thalassotalea fusca]